MMAEITKTYVEILYPGILFSEESVKEVNGRNPSAIVKGLESGAFGFRFYDQVETTIILDGKPKKVASDRKNESGMYYPGGRLFTLDEVKSMGKDFHILASNMEGNNWPIVVRSRVGNFQPFDPKKDEVILA
jgi:hypothetical protein